MNQSFNVEYAKLYGLEEAILIEKFSFLIMENKANRNRKHDKEIEINGEKVIRTFTYNSINALAELFPYLSASTIKRVTRRLCELGILAKAFNTNSLDRTSWYCFIDEEAFLHKTKSRT